MQNKQSSDISSLPESSSPTDTQIGLQRPRPVIGCFFCISGNGRALPFFSPAFGRPWRRAGVGTVAAIQRFSIAVPYGLTGPMHWQCSAWHRLWGQGPCRAGLHSDAFHGLMFMNMACHPVLLHGLGMWSWGPCSFFPWQKGSPRVEKK